MSNPYEAYETDEQIVESGLVLTYDTCKIRVTFADSEVNKMYDKLLKAKLKPYRHQIDIETFTDDAYFNVLKEVYASTVVKGWESKNEAGEFVVGIQDKTGTILPYNKENVVIGFNAMPLRQFKDIVKQASSFALFRKGQIEEDIKN